MAEPGDLETSYLKIITRSPTVPDRVVVSLEDPEIALEPVGVSISNPGFIRTWDLEIETPPGTPVWVALQDVDGQFISALSPADVGITQVPEPGIALQLTLGLGFLLLIKKLRG